MSLKNQLVQLGENHEELRPHLRKILDYLEKNDIKDNWYEENTSLKIEKKEDPEDTTKDTIFVGSPKSLEAFNSVILPQIQSKADAFSFEDMTKMMEEVASLGKAKNTELENALIVYKPVSVDTGKFYEEVQNVFKDWMRPKLKEQEDPSNSGEDQKGNKEYNFNFQ